MNGRRGTGIGVVGLFLIVQVAGCANPADNSTPALVSEAQPVPAAAPVAGETSADATARETAAAADTITIDPNASKVEFVGSKVTGSHNGGFKTFSGTIVLKPDGKEVESITAEIDMGSTWSDNDRLTGHLKSADFFDTSTYPKSRFVSTAVTPGGDKGATHTVTGNLELHGVTKSIRFPATISVKEHEVTLDSDFFIKRQDFGIKYPGKPDDLIRDEVVIKLAIRGAR